MQVSLGTPEAGGPSSSASVASSPLTLATEGIASVQGVVNVAHRLFHEIRSLQFSEVADGKVIPNGASVHPLQELKREYYVHFKKLLEVVQAITERDLTEDVKSAETEVDEHRIAELTERRNALRKIAYEKNLVIKQVIDKLIDIQHNISIMESAQL